jgi:hypothetical protein
MLIPDSLIVAKNRALFKSLRVNSWRYCAKKWISSRKSKAILNTNIVDGFNGIQKYPINPAVIINR